VCIPSSPNVISCHLSVYKALERATYASKSLIIALALVTKHLTVEQASLAATVEVNSQIERWGEVEDSQYFSLTNHVVL